MKKRKKILFLSPIPFIIIILIILILIFLLLYSSLSRIPNEYSRNLIRERECENDSDCINGTCYIGKCSCNEGLSGENCDVSCCDGLDENIIIDCTICNETVLFNTNCTVNEIIFNTNCTVNETIINTNCTVNETIFNTNCTVNETIFNTNCTVEEIIIDSDCICNETEVQSHCLSHGGCKYNGTAGGRCYFGKCICHVGFVGDNCEYQIRDSSNCPTFSCNTGVCILKPPNYTSGECYCPAGSIGFTCISPT